MHVDLSDVDLGAERPVLGATDAAFFTGPDGGTIVFPMSLVGSVTFPRYAAAMRRPDLVADPRFSTPEARLRNLHALRTIVQEWIWTFDDMASLDAQLDEAKIASGRVRGVADLVDSEWASGWGATRCVSDRNGGQFTVPGIPWHFSRDDRATTERAPARRGEHNDEVLRELGYDDAEIAALWRSGALVCGE